MGTIKDRNGKDLTEVREIKKRWQEYTELYNKGLNENNNHNGLVTHLESDILGYEVKLALGSITTNKASGCWNSSWAISNPKRCCCWSAALNKSTKLENSALATGLEKVSFHSNLKEGQCQSMYKLPYNCAHFAC